MKLIYIANARIPTEKAHGYQISMMCKSFAKCGFPQINSTDNHGLLHEDLTYKIRRCIFNVYNTLGFGHKESIYGKALELEFQKEKLNFEAQKRISVQYKNKEVGVYIPDFVVDDKVIIEIKSCKYLSKNETEQARHYLNGSSYKLSLLVNFGAPKLQIERFVWFSQNEYKKNLRKSVEQNQWKSEKIEVELVLPTKKNRIKEDLFSFYKLNKNFEVRKIKSPDFIGIWPKLGKISFWLQNIFFSIAILFTKFEKDAIFYTRGAAIVFILRLRGKKVFFESHRLSNDSLVYRILLGKKTKIISLTHGAKEVYIKSDFLKNNIIVAPDAVDLQVFGNGLSVEEARRRVNLPLNKKIIGYFGSFKTMGEDKGLREIIKAIEGLSRDISLLAVGGLGTELQFYEKEAEKTLGKDRAVFRPSVPRKELSLLEESCDILLMPFPDTVHYRFFMSPLKMFEYMASKRPIVATDLPSIREVLSESSAVLVPPGNTEKLKEAIKYLIDNPEAGKKLADNAFQKVQEYTWDKRAEKIVDFITDFHG